MFDVDTTNISKITQLDHFLGVTPFSRTLLITLNIIIILIGIAGNSFVLYASANPEHLKIDTMSMRLLRNIAVNNVIISVLYYGPILITLMCNRWVLGSVICYFTGIFSCAVPFANDFLVTVSLSCYRLYVVVKGSARRHPTSIQTNLFIALLWLLSFTPTLILSVLYNIYAYFSPYLLTCIRSGYTDQGYMSVYLVILSCMLALVAVVANFTIRWLIVRQHFKVQRAGKLSTNALLIVSSISCSMLLSYIPYCIRVIKDAVKYPSLDNWFYIFQVYMLSINVVILPVIYIFSFRQFRNKLTNLSSRISVRVRLSAHVVSNAEVMSA